MTPSAIIANNGEHPRTWLARQARIKFFSGIHVGMPLSIAVQVAEPHDAVRFQSPVWTALLMGWPAETP